MGVTCAAPLFMYSGGGIRRTGQLELDVDINSRHASVVFGAHRKRPSWLPHTVWNVVVVMLQRDPLVAMGVDPPNEATAKRLSNRIWP